MTDTTPTPAVADEKARELLPCPFCGHHAKHQERHNPMSRWRHSIECCSSTCGMSGPVAASKREAIELWSARAAIRPEVEPVAHRSIEATQITMGRGLVDVTRIEHEGRSGILFRPRDRHIPVGDEGELQPGDYWPVAGDVVIWIENEGGARVIEKYLATFLASPPAPAVKVKDLEWQPDPFSDALIADTNGLGRYVIEPFEGGFKLEGGNVRAARDTVEELQAKAQKDLVARIRSSLLPPEEAQAATPAEALPSQTSGVEADVLTSLWACQAWGDGSSAPGFTNVVCPDCEVVIAANQPVEVAVHIAGLHNAALAKPAREG